MTNIYLYVERPCTRIARHPSYMYPKLINTKITRNWDGARFLYMEVQGKDKPKT